MKFRVTGSNRDTGARMTLEFEADNRAAAERKAVQSGMSVNHIQDITEHEEGDEPARPRSSRRGEDVGGGSKLLAMLIFLIVAAGLVYFFWPKIRPLIGR